MTGKLLIIGGVAGGATAAARARRLDEQAEIILFERGEHISFANCGLPYYIGGVIDQRDSLLVTTAEAFRNRYRIDVRASSEVLAIDRKRKEVQVRNLVTGDTYRESYDKIILSPGAEPVRPAIEGIELENVFTLRTIPDADRIKGYVDAKGPCSAVMVGAGYIGLEMAENLARNGVKVTILEKLDQVLDKLDPEMAATVNGYIEEKGVICRLGSGAKAFARHGDSIIVTTEGGDEVLCDLVIVCAGVRPENRLAREAGLELGRWGGIKVNGLMMTSDPDIFAVGDAVEMRDYVTGLPTMTALAGPANRQGRIAADNSVGRRSVYKGTLGTAIVKIFEMTAASTGASERTLQSNNIPCCVSYTHSGSHAGYYPDAKMMTIKLIFSPGNGRILGCQIVGMEGVDKRIDVLSAAIRGSMTVFDLEELELAYAPPFSSAKDPVNVAGFVASNILKGDHDVIHSRDLTDLNPTETVIIDVRDAEDVIAGGMIEGASHIPLNRLRRKISKLDREKNYVLYCDVGIRSYIGHRILLQNGLKSRNLSGGYKTYLSTRRR
jgi:NADPH-dependent 2,4-dienoyl-CoA reductase/sulfur reductase-like enzyme/rhodanese-related sulfurtransferase